MCLLGNKFPIFVQFSTSEGGGRAFQFQPTYGGKGSLGLGPVLVLINTLTNNIIFVCVGILPNDLVTPAAKSQPQQQDDDIAAKRRQRHMLPLCVGVGVVVGMETEVGPRSAAL